MANWSRTMWQSVVNRAIRMLALGPFRSNFFSASATTMEEMSDKMQFRGILLLEFKIRCSTLQ
ncbi:hypothetical protein KIN20_019254 [Parelaphostrongylus tenuis]|uniref:Uncharacterized protein n=1 Tax=Parelaphostrongylus tenuis TaxID=148309 RepID=A0AAD5N5B3_PARTN|nr:hypothetical protein KIN20_019254 [Parelaphostrongylus tenuis]